MSLECTLFRKWGEGCKYDCSAFCEGDCNKFSGDCQQCVAGRKDRYANCSRECGEFQYGIDCLGNCSTLCNFHDCIDRVTGRCNVHTTSMYPHVEESGPSFMYVVIIIIFSFMVIGAVFAMMSGNQAEPDAVQSTEKVDHYLNKKMSLWDEETVRTKRKRSGSNVDEPDAFNSDYMQQNAQFKEGKYWALSTLKTFFSPSASPDKLKGENGSPSLKAPEAVDVTPPQATSLVAEEAINVSDAVDAAAERVKSQATAVLNLEAKPSAADGDL